MTISLIYGLPYDNTNGLNNGCVIQQYPVATGAEPSPGFFEFSMTLDSAPQTWTGGFYEFGTNGSCLGDVAQNGTELDMAETIGNYIGLHYNGYNQCATAAGGGNNHAVAGETHVWGVDYGDNGQMTMYVDGVQEWQWAPADGVEPGTCPSGALRCSNGNWMGQFIFWNFECFIGTCTTTSNGSTIHWVRHYHH